VAASRTACYITVAEDGAVLFISEQLAGSASLQSAVSF